MRILVSLTYYLPNISGLTIYAKNLAEEFAKLGHEVSILTSQHVKNIPLQEKQNGIEIYHVPVSIRFGKGVIMFSFLFHATKLVYKSEVINCHLPQFESALLAILGKLFRKKVIVTYHTDIHDIGLLNKIGKVALTISHLITAKLADKIIVQTEEYVKSSGFLKLFKNKIVYIYPPIVLHKYSRKTLKTVSNQIDIKKGYKIGLVSRLAKEKGVEYLLATIPILCKKLKKDFRIIIVGPTNPVGEKEYADKVKRLISNYSEHVIMLGSITFEELAALYSCLDVLVLPSINSTEAFGMVQIEAMLSGVPVVATDLPGVSVPIKLSGMGETVPIRDTQSLAESIIRVLTIKEYKRHNIENIFSLKQTIEQYEKAFTY